MENQYHATPYDITALGFYFSDYEEYSNKAAKHRNAYGEPVEEYEIQFIDGDSSALFSTLSINQATLKQWFDEFEMLEGMDYVKALYLASEGFDSQQILNGLESVQLYECSAEEYTQDYIEDTGMLDGMPDNLRFYFDVKSFTRDAIMSGDISEVQIEGVTYTVCVI